MPHLTLTIIEFYNVTLQGQGIVYSYDKQSEIFPPTWTLDSDKLGVCCSSSSTTAAVMDDNYALHCHIILTLHIFSKYN